MASDLSPNPTMSSPLKRPHPEADAIDTPSTPLASAEEVDDSPLSSPGDIDTPKDTPMALSILDTSTAGNTPSKAPTTTQSHLPSSNPQQISALPPAKRRKLTSQEKAEREAERASKAAEKEAKEKARLEAKAQKDAEAKAKAEEKEEKRKAVELDRQQKEEEKRKKAEEKEEKAKIKEFEKRNKEEEKERRERSQLRLNSFFKINLVFPPVALPTTKAIKASASPSKAPLITKDEARRRSMSLDPVDFSTLAASSSDVKSDAVQQAKKDGNVKGFLPFIPGKSMTLAPANRFLPTGDDLIRVNAALDNYGTSPPSQSPTVLESFATERIQRGYQPPEMQHIMQRMHSSAHTPVDLTRNAGIEPLDLLRSIPVKFLFFGEDVRPRYRGTWTRPVVPNAAIRFARNPWRRELPDVNYDYDSEAEWDDADEGEDIEVDGDEDEDEDEEDEEGFIDDENVPAYLKARKDLNSTTDLITQCSGLQWEDGNGKLRAADPKKEDADFSEFAICYLLEPHPKTIDPFTTLYWDPEPVTLSTSTSSIFGPSNMGPPRQPLTDRTNSPNIQSALVNGKIPKANTKAGPKLVPADFMDEFIKAVSGSDMTKIAIIEALKKQFPKLTKDQITHTLPVIAERVGPKQSEKKWVLKELKT